MLGRVLIVGRLRERVDSNGEHAKLCHLKMANLVTVEGKKCINFQLRESK
jgi:hypothetical protein